MKLSRKTDESSQQAQVPGRRNALKIGALGGMALATPAVSVAQTTTLRFQSAWPAKTIFHEFAVDASKDIEQATGGRVKIQMLPAGAVVPTPQILEAVSSGTLDGGHSIPAFWFGRNTAFGLYGAGPNFGMDATQLLGWVEQGGGRELYAEALATAKLNVVAMLYGPIPCEPFGWFRKELKSVDDIKGLKYRTSGLSVDMMQTMGAVPVQLAPGDIVPSLERGVIDAAEFANITDDRLLGFPDVAKFYYLQSYHQANNVFDLTFHKPKFDALPDDVKRLIQVALDASSSRMTWKAMSRMSDDLIAMQAKNGVKVLRTPQPILNAQLDAWTKVIATRSAENALFAKTVESQKAWAKKVVYLSELTTVPAGPAYRKFFA